MDKTRAEANQVSGMALADGGQHIAGHPAVIVDDMADTCGTLVRAVEVLAAAGATRVFAAVAHGVFSGSALERIAGCPWLERVMVTDTLPQEGNVARCPKVRCVRMAAGRFAEAIRAITNEELKGETR